MWGVRTTTILLFAVVGHSGGTGSMTSIGRIGSLVSLECLAGDVDETMAMGAGCWASYQSIDDDAEAGQSESESV